MLASTERGLDLGGHLAEQGHELVTTSDTGDELDAQLTDAEVVITTPFWPLYLGRERIEQAEELKLVITAGVGSDHVDSDAATEHGITVAEVTGSNVVSVAEHNVLQILALVRNFVPAHQQVLDGRWDVADAAQDAHDLEGKTVGIIGLGAIGARTALRLKPFDVTMLYHARHRRSPADESVLGVRYSRLDHLVAQSDVVCAALPLRGGSRALFDAERLATMKKGAWLHDHRGPEADRRRRTGDPRRTPRRAGRARGLRHRCPRRLMSAEPHGEQGPCADRSTAEASVRVTARGPCRRWESASSRRVIRFR